MIEFKEVELSDKQWVRELLSYSAYRGCEYTFGNNFLWQYVFKTKIARYKDFYFAKSNSGYFFPAGRGDFRQAVEILRRDAAENGERFRFVTMNKSSMEFLGSHYPNEFVFHNDPGVYDYIYNFEDLAELKGRKYHSKRNFINRFREYPDWRYESIMRENISECAEMSRRWLKENESADRNIILESKVVNIGLENFFDLDFTGGLLRVDGEVIAFTFGESVTNDTFVIHAEKAFSRITGSYPAINNKFISYACADYKFINREEDMGVENLRKAKMSYHPAFMEEKFSAVSNN